MAEAPVGDESQASPVEIETSVSGPEERVAGRSDIGKRLAAALIDVVITVVVGFIPFVGGLVATAYWLVRDGMDLELMDHRSIGKKVMKLRPVTIDGSPVDIATSVKRNWMFALGGIGQVLVFTIIGIVIAIPLFLAAFVIGIIEIVLVVTDGEGRRFGDKLAGTRVIETTS